MSPRRFWRSRGFWSVVAFGGVMAIAAFLRLYRLPEFPPFFNFDEAAHATDAQLILSGHHFIFSPKIQGVEALFMYVTAGAFALFGQTPLAQRLVSAVVGIATVAATYLWVREMFRQDRPVDDPAEAERRGDPMWSPAPPPDHAGAARRGDPTWSPALSPDPPGATTQGRPYVDAETRHATWLALIAALGLATSFWHVNYSRIGLEVTMVPLCAAFMAYFLWRGLRTGRAWNFVVSGIWLGLGPYTHLPARFLPFPLVFFFAILWALSRRAPEARGLSRWARAWRCFRPLIVVGVAALIVFAPLGIHFVLHPADFTGRASVTSIFNPMLNEGDFWGTLWRSAVGTFGGFGFTSDQNWLANLPGKSIFDPAMAALFWLGIATALARIRRPAYLFSFLWWFLLLVPPIITPERTPHFARMMSDAPVAYLFVAVGLWTLGEILAPLLEPGRTLWFTFADSELRFVIGYPEFLPPWQKALSRVAHAVPIAAVAALFAWTAVSTYHDYFDVWAHSSEHYMAFDGYAVALTNTMMADADPQAVYVLPRDVRAGEFYQHYTIDFLDRGGAPYFYIPMSEPRVPALLTAACRGKTVVRLVKWKMDKHREADPKDYVEWLLERYGRRTGSQSFPAYDIVTYRLPSTEGVDFTQPVAFAPVDADFAGRLRLTQAACGSAGQSAPEAGRDVPSGGEIWAALSWMKTADYADDYRVSLILEDAGGHEIDHFDRDLLHNWHMRTGAWPLNEAVADYLLLPVPAGTPPGDYVVRAAVYAAQTMERLPLAGSAVTTAVVGRVRVTPPLEPVGASKVDAPQHPMSSALGDGLELTGFDLDLSRDYAPGERATLALLWRVAAPPQGDDRVAVELRRDGRAIEVYPAARPLGDGYPTTRWARGDAWRGLYDLRLPPDLSAGTYELWVTLAGGAGGRIGEARLAEALSVAGRAHRFDVPPMSHPQPVDLGGGKVRFLGYDLDAAQAAPGGTLALTLHWQALRAMDVAYTVFAHVLDADSRVRAQLDVPAGGTEAPTTGWLPGEVVSDRLELPLDAELAPGRYALEVGLYDSADGLRLAAADGTDRIILGEVTIGRSPDR